jgi:hypothetical protein
MLLLLSTLDKVQLITDAAVTVDVHASYVDHISGSVTFGRKNTAIITATTTDVVLAPAADVQRKLKVLVVQNRHATLSVGVTVQHTDGTVVVRLAAATLGPGHTLQYLEGVGWSVVRESGIAALYPHFGAVACAHGDGDPNRMLLGMQNAGNVAPTPTNITASIARCSSFMLPANLTVNKLRYYAVGAPGADIFRVAIYRYSDLARLTADLSMGTPVANTWMAVGDNLGLALVAGVLYFVAVSVTTTGTTAGPAAFGGTIAATTGQIQSAPGALPGNLDLDLGKVVGYQFQFAVTAGALPDPAPALAAQANWTGGMPAIFLDADNS